MTENKGFVIHMSSVESVSIALKHGVFGQHVKFEENYSPYSSHFDILADYSCARDGDHVFLFKDNQIYYAGQITGNSDGAAFKFNGETPVYEAQLAWDESKRDDKTPAQRDGLFYTEKKREKGKQKVHQPYLLLFDTKSSEYAGLTTGADEYYYSIDEASEIDSPLPSNSMKRRGFGPITPAETRVMLDVVKQEGRRPEIIEDIQLNFECEPIEYNPSIALNKDTEFVNEAHLEAAILANPSLYPVYDENSDFVCRQSPLTPNRSEGIDRPDISIYNGQNPMWPKKVVEIKNGKASERAANQINKYYKWTQQKEYESQIAAFASGYTDSFYNTLNKAPVEHVQQMSF